MKAQRDYHFGPLRRSDGRWVFRLWAPSAGSVALELRQEKSAPARTIVLSSRNADPAWRESPPVEAREGDEYRFLIDGELPLPHPPSRCQRDDAHARTPRHLPAPPPPPQHHPPAASVISEIHVGAAGARPGHPGTFRDLIPQLPEISAAGITVVELLPVSDFPGRWNWGYDGVLPFAPDRSYGSPEDLVDLVAAAHQQGIAVWMDVVYNHFGPDGNYLHAYAAPFFSSDIDTPWGAGIDFSRPAVRRFFIENALYWIHEYGIDGLRFDAVHAIHDTSAEHILTELSRTVRESLPEGRRVHLILENAANQARFLRAPAAYDGQWNDDIHHVFHVLLTGERHGYYADFAAAPEAGLLRALCEGYVYQGEPAGVENGGPRGEPSGDLPPTRFVSFLQNHDQIGNRAWGERLSVLARPEALSAATAVHLLAPQIPLLFMGEHWGSTTPFMFFCDFPADLEEAVRSGRRREFGLTDVPDPGADQTFYGSAPAIAEPGFRGGAHAALVAELLSLRHRHLVPLLGDIGPGHGSGGGEQSIGVRYPAAGMWWCLEANLSEHPRPRSSLPRNGSTQPVFAFPKTVDHAADYLPSWSVLVWKDHQ